MSTSCGNPRRRRRRPPPQSRPLRPRPRRRRPQPRRLLLPPHRLPLQVHGFQRRVATRGVYPLQSRQRTVARRERIAVPGLVAAHPSKTIARALSRTLCQKGSAAIPAWRGRVPVASAVAPGAVVNTELLPRHLPFLPSERGDESLEPRCSTSVLGAKLTLR